MRGAGRVRRGVRTRGGIRNVANRQSAKDQAERELEGKWKKEDTAPTVPEFTGEGKINAELPDDPSTLDFLDLYLDNDFYEYLTIQTNLYAAQYLAAHAILPRYSRAKHWRNVTIDEMKQFIALYLLTGIVKKPEISQYWSTNPINKSPYFNEVMPRNRFQRILEFLHFNDNSQYEVNDSKRDKLFKIRPVVNYLVEKFKAVYTPEKTVSIDEELLLWKGRLGFKQYIPNKRSRFGIKMFSLCETSGYLWNSFVYLGKEANVSPEEAALQKELGKSGAVVPKLMSDLYGKGHHLYVDNWYTSEKLFRHLEQNGTAACGTAMGYRLKVPKSLKTEPLEKGEHVFRRNENLLIVRYRDKKEIYFLSTIHEVKIERVPRRGRDEIAPSKLSLVNDYNKNMGGVDHNDALTSSYSSIRKTLKWTLKVVIHFIEKTVSNSYLLHDKVNPGQLRFMHYKLDVIEKTINRAKNAAAASQEYHVPTTGRHFLELIPSTTKKSNPQKKCVECTKKGIRKESRYQCKNCVVRPGLCPAPCFESYHINSGN